jgi:hypothetical protein
MSTTDIRKPFAFLLLIYAAVLASLSPWKELGGSLVHWSLRSFIHPAGAGGEVLLRVLGVAFFVVSALLVFRAYRGLMPARSAAWALPVGASFALYEPGSALVFAIGFFCLAEAISDTRPSWIILVGICVAFSAI